MLIRHSISGYRNRVYASLGSLFVPLFDAVVPKHDNVLAVLESEEGKRRFKLLIPAHNIVTDAGDIWYAQKSCGESPTNNFTSMVMCSAGTPGKAAIYSGFTAIAGSTKVVTATYPKTADADADNTGDAANVATWLGSWAKADFNNAAISHGLITIGSPIAGSALLTGYAFGSPFAKTANDTLKVFVNHQLLGV
jgi:hypothetical protein